MGCGVDRWVVGWRDGQMGGVGRWVWRWEGVWGGEMGCDMEVMGVMSL